MSACLFCQIIAKEVPATILHEDDHALVFLDLDQAAKGHLLLVPKQHQAQWHHLDDGTIGHLGRLAATWAARVVSRLNAHGYNLMQNNGPAAGQEVLHVHLHLIPRWQGDKLFGGMAHRQATPDELAQTAALLQGA